MVGSNILLTLSFIMLKNDQNVFTPQYFCFLPIFNVMNGSVNCFEKAEIHFRLPLLIIPCHPLE